MAIKLSCSPIFMLVALVLVVVCAGPSVCKLPIVDLRRFPRLLDFLVASARSFHSFYSASRFSYPASLAVGRRVVVTAASRPNVTRCRSPCTLARVDLRMKHAATAACGLRSAAVFDWPLGVRSGRPCLLVVDHSSHRSIRMGQCTHVTCLTCLYNLAMRRHLGN